MNKLLLSFFILISFSSLAQNVIINGALLNNSYKNVKLQHIGIEINDVATSRIEDNKFTFNTNVKETDLYKLSFAENAFIMLIISPDEKISLEGDMSDLSGSIKIKGSINSALIYETDKNLKIFTKDIDSLNAIYYKYSYSPNIDSVKEALSIIAEKIEKNKKEYLRNFISKNSKSLACIFFYELIDIDEDYDILNSADSILYNIYPENYFVKSHHEKIIKSKSIATGMVAPEIDLPDPDGINIKLSSLKGKYVLIDFWASWCGPCRKESPNMVNLYKKYKDKGFEIYSVSLDKTKDAWVNAIKADNLNWTHVSDLKFWSSEAAKNYNVTSIPFTVLIDKEGKIIAKGLRGETLDEKLSEHLK